MATAQWGFASEPQMVDPTGWSYSVGTITSMDWLYDAGAWEASDSANGSGVGYATSSGSWETMFGIPSGSTITHVQVTYFDNITSTGDPDQLIVMHQTTNTELLSRYPTDTRTNSSGTNVQLATPQASSANAGLRVEFYRNGSSGGTDGLLVYGMTLVATYTDASPIWVSPADTAEAAPGDALVWTSSSATKRAHFKLQIASDSGFSSGLSTYYSYANSGFEYWDGSAWQTLGNAGMPSAKTGNNVRYTATSGLSGTKYRRVAQTS